jgi:hypothetical protein
LSFCWLAAAAGTAGAAGIKQRNPAAKSPLLALFQRLRQMLRSADEVKSMKGGCTPSNDPRPRSDPGPFCPSDVSGLIPSCRLGRLRWLLCRDEDGRVFVLHKANVPSGGKATKIELGDFLGRGKASPEHQALARLIGSLVDRD